MTRESRGPPRKAFAYGAEGEILQRRMGTATGGTFSLYDNGGYATQHYAYVQGQQIGSVNEHGDINVLSAVTGFSNSDAGSSDYVVQADDTLQSIARQVYGDASLWYVVADANGLINSGDLVAGQMLKLPQVTTSSNTAETFKPYNPTEISGSTTPSLPQAPMPAPSAHGCNTLAAIVVIAVAVVVSVSTYGALTSQAAGWAGWEVGAIAGAAGSATSQVAGNVLGTQRGFDWDQVLVGAAGGAIGGGLAKTFSGANGSFLAAPGGNGVSAAGNAIIGAASYAGTYEAQKLVGEPAHFSWAGLIADTVGSAAGGRIGPTKADTAAGRTLGNILDSVGARAVQSAVQREVSLGLGDSHVPSWQQIGVDAFGNALGNAALAGIRAYQVPEIDVPGLPIDIAPPTTSLMVGDIPQSITSIGRAQLSAHTVQSGDTLSGIAGTSDPRTIGMLMRLNGLTSSMIRPGMQLQLGDLANYGADQVGQFGQLGQATLNHDNSVLAARAYGDGPALAWAPQASSREIAYQGYLPSGGTNPSDASLGSLARNFASAAGNAIVDTFKQPVLQAYDLGQVVVGIGYNMTHADVYEPTFASSIGEEVQGGSFTTGGQFRAAFGALPVVGQAIIGWQAGTDIRNGDWNALARDAGGLFGGMIGGKVMDGGVSLTSLRAAGSVPNTTATSIGKSGYASVHEFSDAVYTKYQGFVDEGYAVAKQDLQDGILRIPSGVSEQTVLGTRTDQYARTAMQEWLTGEGIDEGTGQLIQVNRYLRDPAGSGSYRIPDVNIPGANRIYDATLGFKTWSTPQVRGFYQYSGGSTITIVRPTELGGSYSVLVPR